MLFRSYDLFHFRSNGLALSSKNPAVDLMEKKIKELENENNVLKSSVIHYSCFTIMY